MKTWSESTYLQSIHSLMVDMTPPRLQPMCTDPQPRDSHLLVLKRRLGDELIHCMMTLDVFSAAYLDLRCLLQAAFRLPVDGKCCLQLPAHLGTCLYVHVPNLGAGDSCRRAASLRRARSPRRQSKHTTRTANNTLYSINHSATPQITSNSPKVASTA